MASTSQKRLEILYVEPRKSKSGNAYQVAQCIVHEGDVPKVGEFWHFNQEIVLEKGNFVCDTELDVYDGKVGAKIIALHPWGRPAAAAAPTASASAQVAAKQ